ncbi:hypothetical protein [Rubritalea sp.]|uniref:hypothetical protein n=1 Tax=Rubritalea sp. TaxID=2109375 RepID=UPI003EF43FD3
MNDSNTPDKEKEKDVKSLGWLLNMMAIIWGIFSIIGIAFWYFGMSEQAAQFGDWFGSVNAFLTSLTLAFAIYATRLQSKELELSRKEHSESRKALQKSAIFQETQAEIATLDTALTSYIRQREADLTTINKEKTEIDSLSAEIPKLKIMVNSTLMEYVYTPEEAKIRLERAQKRLKKIKQIYTERLKRLETIPNRIKSLEIRIDEIVEESVTRRILGDLY